MDNALTMLSRWVAESPFNKASLATQRARAAVHDIVACMLAGSQAAVTLRTAKAIQDLGSGPCSGLGGHRIAAPWAALLNGTAAHALDFDDYDFPAVSHPSAVLVPAAFALAEELGASGAEVLDAYIVGYEAMAFVGKAVNMAHYERGWHATATMGALGAAAACGRLMRMKSEDCAAALSIATSMAAGFKSQFGTMTKPLHAGLAAKNGVLAARLAGSGITASQTTFDGPWSILTLLGGDGAKGFERALAELGKPLAIEQFGLVAKRFPTCSYTHRAIAGILQLKRLHCFEFSQVERIEALLPDRNARVLTYPQAETEAQARFSMQYCLASAVYRGHVRESDFAPAALMQAEVRELMGRITLLNYPADPNGTDSSPEEPDHVRVWLNNRDKLEITIREVPGGPSNPLSELELSAKLHQCGDPVIGPESVAELELALRDFAQLPNLQAVTCHFLSFRVHEVSALPAGQEPLL